MLPSLMLDVSDNNIPAAVEQVADWMEASGGLYMPDYWSRAGISRDRGTITG